MMLQYSLGEAVNSLQHLRHDKFDGRVGVPSTPAQEPHHMDTLRWSNPSSYHQVATTHLLQPDLIQWEFCLFL